MNRVKVLVLILSLVYLNPVQAIAQISKDEALSEFVSAGLAYKEGRYDAAISHYKTIIEGGRVSGPLYYNLANSYYKKQDFGNAILNYERAKRYIPRDSDLNFNSAYAQSKIDRYGSKQKLSFIDRAEQNFIQFYTIDEMLIVLISLVFTVGVIYLIGLYARLPQTLSSGLTVICLIGLLTFGAGLISKINSQQNVAIIMTKSDSYFEPRGDSTVHFKLSEGMKVKILKSEFNWVKIERLDGKVGWVDREVMERI